MTRRWFVAKWVARLHGWHNGRRQMPDMFTAELPAYILKLKEGASADGNRIGLAWLARDKRLARAYAVAAGAYGTALDAVSQASQQAAELERAYQAKPTQKAKHRREKARADLKAALCRADKQSVRLEAAIRARSNRFEEAQARAGNTFDTYRALMQCYVEANQAARDGYDLPPVLREEALPHLDLPEALRELAWDPPIAAARAGETRPYHIHRSGAAVLPGGPGMGADH